MNKLDNLEEIANLDKGKILESISALANQIKDSWKGMKVIQVPENYREVSNIFVSGMGGSALGGRIIQSLLVSSLSVPLEIITEYKLPASVNNKSLVILSSYSGNTEEILSAASDALSKNSLPFIIATGGKLSEFASKNNIPAFIFNPSENPSGQPRMSLGYSITAILAILNKLGYSNFEDKEVNGLIEFTEKLISQYGVRAPSDKNTAKLLADKVMGKIPVIISSSHLKGSAHAFKNQLNENSKTFSVSFDIPELNHHLMEGLKNPPRVQDSLIFILFQSELYSKELIKRYEVTVKVLEQNEVPYEIYKLQAKDKLKEVFEILVLGSYVSFYLSILYGTDPAAIPWVDYFKNELAK